MTLPILYSLRHCPYAMRARLGILRSQIPILLRPIVLKDKPADMLAASPKGTVPVLIVDDTTVIDESLDVMLWALNKNDPDDLLLSHDPSLAAEMLALVARNDNEFIDALDQYKCTKRYHDDGEVECRSQCEVFILHLEQRLDKYQFLMGESPSLADYAILPFVRRFARVDRLWYRQAPYPKLRQWLNAHLQSKLFSKVMTEYPLWLESKAEVVLGRSNNYKKLKGS
jgi:glutathione S-transferase